jgi:hypothetical protein
MTPRPRYEDNRYRLAEFNLGALVISGRYSRRTRHRDVDQRETTSTAYCTVTTLSLGRSSAVGAKSAMARSSASLT